MYRRRSGSRAPPSQPRGMGDAAMAKFNKAASAVAKRSPYDRRIASGATYEGAPGFARDAKSELFLLAVANMVGEDTFYERRGRPRRALRAARRRGGRRRRRLDGAGSCPGCAPRPTCARRRWSARCEAACAMVARGHSPGSRPVVASRAAAGRRAGRGARVLDRRGTAAPFPKPVKRGIADAVAPALHRVRAAQVRHRRARASGSAMCST